jgi:hypothetical protein
VFIKSGTTLTVRRNGVQTATGAFTKAATTTAAFTLGAYNPAANNTCTGEFGLWYGATSAFSGQALVDLENWLAKKTGYG